ncbi:hypothetical protein SAMN05444277_102153 [Parafilimonas terrae]|uniref:Uncharacterized protein n=1 Tax=Parafilimonas terrae TaxID=1465490 RepID=A0A1I5TIN1_9BACT|nr:hypothetical protein SAMN05444277_102153 [Parafilimonas terrae]
MEYWVSVKEDLKLLSHFILLIALGFIICFSQGRFEITLSHLKPIEPKDKKEVSVKEDLKLLSHLDSACITFELITFQSRKI